MNKYKICFFIGSQMIASIIESSSFENAMATFYRKNKGKKYQIISAILQ
jgi:hypothetical protein